MVTAKILYSKVTPFSRVLWIKAK